MALTRSIGLISKIAKPTAILTGALALAAFSQSAKAEPASCLSPNPADWPASSKPYFMLVVDSSGSMTTSVGATDSCGYGSDRIAHARCAIKNTALAFGGEVNLGLATFAVKQLTCNAACYSGCTYECFQAEINTTGLCNGCGPRPGGAATRAGAFIRVPMQQDNFWQTPQAPSNVSQIISWADNNCSSNTELFALGATPLNGSLRDMQRYFSTSWTDADNTVTYTTPLAAQDLTGAGVNGSTGCRSVNVILMTDGDETCDAQADAVSAAQTLYQTGVTVGGKTYKIRTHVINFAGGSVANTDQIAAAGGTTASYFATNEVQLSQAFANIISSAIKPETCDNTDNNCNGCTDEGFKHYCNTNPTCCNWATPAQRTNCLNTYKASITPMNPTGNLGLLPCTTAVQQADPVNWLCFNPKEACDNADNNCQDGVDEGVTKCGNPAHCPVAEVCGNADDDDCDGAVDEGCPFCIPSQEICDGCDNDCDGVADDGVGALPCGLPSPPNCAGTQTCKAPQVVPVGQCVANGGFNPCSNNPQAEVCDNIDNDCDGIPDDNVAPTACVPPGTPGGLNYGPNSQCKQGQQACGQMTCVGFVGPTPEICDNIDNDCDGQVDEGVVGVGQACGLNQPPCTPGTTACISGVLVCQGGVGPQPEQCDGIDNDCDGTKDDAPLSDAPAMGQTGCWTQAGACCTFDNLSWCPPPGANCNDVGTLAAPCAAGTLTCSGAAGWVCQGSKAPAAEVCDGVDNNCNMQIDEGNLPQVGDVCGSDVGECKSGTLACTAGVLDCMGAINPMPESCDGLDNDCDNQIDNGVSIGSPCLPAFNQIDYPNTPTDPLMIGAPCQPGILLCNGMGGSECSGGIGPTPELCDGIDNDCDGQIDETGPQPSGIDGTANPFDPTQVVGGVCSQNQGECKEGVWACVNNQFACVGGQGPTTEQCDCLDNNCDGTSDNQVPNAPSICTAGKTCVQAGANNCQCAKPCTGGEFDCPGGQKCVAATDSQGNPLGLFCVVDESQSCGDCASKTVTDANGTVICAPGGAQGPNCTQIPACTCKGAQNGCKDPCFGVTCAAGTVCTNFGANAGTCVADNCFNVPCPGCDKLCTDQGTCVDNPCTDTACPGQVCKPSADNTMPVCSPSCADVMCAADQVCKDGVCVSVCNPACAANEYCNYNAQPPACAPNLCTPTSCTAGGCCDPATGACGACPCEGVVCPMGQACKDGECAKDNPTSSSSSSSTSSGMSTSSGGAGGSGGGGVFGQPTGGGGCTCEVGPGAQREKDSVGWLALAALAFAGLRRRNDKKSGEVL